METECRLEGSEVAGVDGGHVWLGLVLVTAVGVRGEDSLHEGLPLANIPDVSIRHFVSCCFVDNADSWATAQLGDLSLRFTVHVFVPLEIELAVRLQGDVGVLAHTGDVPVG